MKKINYLMIIVSLILFICAIVIYNLPQYKGYRATINALNEGIVDQQDNSSSVYERVADNSTNSFLNGTIDKVKKSMKPYSISFIVFIILGIITLLLNASIFFCKKITKNNKQ